MVLATLAGGKGVFAPRPSSRVPRVHVQQGVGNVTAQPGTADDAIGRVPGLQRRDQRALGRIRARRQCERGPRPAKGRQKSRRRNVMAHRPAHEIPTQIGKNHLPIVNRDSQNPRRALTGQIGATLRFTSLSDRAISRSRAGRTRIARIGMVTKHHAGAPSGQLPSPCACGTRCPRKLRAATDPSAACCAPGRAITAMGTRAAMLRQLSQR